MQILEGDNTLNLVTSSACCYAVLKSSDCGILHLELLGFWTLSVSWYAEQKTKHRKLLPVSSLRRERWGGTCSFGPIGKN
jgi:hypothetical protein